MIGKRLIHIVIFFAVLATNHVIVFSQTVERLEKEFRFQQSPFGFDLRVPVSVNGKNLSFIVDTGCTYNLVDQTHREVMSRYFRNVDVRSIGGSHQSPLFTRNDVAVSEVFNVKSDLLVVDLSRISSQFAEPVDGCLGMNALRAIGFGFDGADNTLYFGRDPNREFAVQSALTWSNTQTPQSRDVEIEGVDVAFEVDTGADNGLSVPPEMFTSLVQEGKIHSVFIAQSSSTYGAHSYRSGRLASAKIWGVVFQDIPINDSSHPRIGMDILSKFDFYFDFSNELLLLQPTVRCSEPFQYDRSGLQLSSLNNQIVVSNVGPSSPADKIGVITGDILMTVNDRPVDRKDLDQVKTLLDDPRNEKLNVRIRRHDQNYAGSIQLRDYRKSGQ